MTWSNWSGLVSCAPRRIVTPSDEAGIVAAVREAAREGLSLRVAGSGHSFTPLVATDGVILSLDDWQGIESCEPERARATVRAGTKLSALGRDLLAHGLAMENLGDVDVQALAGAVSTGTHGTGERYRNISSQVAALRLVGADGRIVEYSEEGDAGVLDAARVSLGLLGVVSAVTLRLLPAFRLHERVWRIPATECLEGMEGWIAANEHFEFFWYPQADAAECKTLNTTALTPETAALGEEERLGWSAEILPSVRATKFNEMEYALPAEAGRACFLAVRERMLRHHPEVTWPVEYRTLAADSAWLSPAHGRATVTISIHQHARMPHQAFFADIERIFRSFDGRPHWGKLHSCSREDLRALYPRWDDFAALRAEVDPDGRFLNDYLRGLFLPG